jgi:hypothetical protein
MDDNFYLILLSALLVFFFVISVYSKSKSENFSQLNEFSQLDQNQTDIYRLDTRYDYPTQPPVNPIAYKSVILNKVPADKGLFSKQEMIKDGMLLNENEQSTLVNQLETSGGNMELIKIPLQFNDPVNEQLRSQEILITPYNAIKYKSC